MYQTETLTEDESTGILYRPNTFDEFILKESRSYFPLNLKDSDSILDIGGHIGCFSARAMLEKDVVCLSIEPELSNFTILQANSVMFNFEVMFGAVVSDVFHKMQLDLYVNKLTNNALHSMIPVRGRPTQKTKGWGFNYLLNDFHPTIIKIDIEGGEYDLPWDELPKHPSIRMVIMELHLTHKGHREKAEDMNKLFMKMGFHVIWSPKIGKKNWTTLARYER